MKRFIIKINSSKHEILVKYHNILTFNLKFLLKESIYKFIIVLILISVYWGDTEVIISIWVNKHK